MFTPAYAAEESLTSPDIQETTAAEGTEKLKEEQKIPAITGPVILEINVQGNVEVVTEHIMSIITSKVGEPVDEEKLRKDAEAIFELGFFVATDYRVTDKADGVSVVFLVQENPVVSKINFEGNTVYSNEELEEMIFTKPGMIFNRTFFRNDLQRIKEKYQSDGYVMANVADVRIEGTEINVVIVEPKISQIIIQGNKITKTHIVRRYLKIKEGELFNANKLRLSLSRLQGVGFFSDVNVNFEPDEDPNDVIVVLTVEEGRTGKLGFNIAYGTQSGFGGGLSYENSNIGGRGMKLSVGFDLGDREEYWASYEQPYMGGKVTAWKIGAYKRAWSDLYYYANDEKQFEYDRDKTGAFFGFGRKFKEDSLYNWYLLFDWHEVQNDPDNPPAKYNKSNWGNVDIEGNSPPLPGKETLLEDLGDGTYYSATASVRRLNIDEYLPYSKGDVQTINVQYGQADVEGVDYSFFKYWLEARFYFPLEKFFRDFFETSFGQSSDRPVIFAARIIAGSSSGDVPYEQMYTVGGDTTLRGYDDDRYHGEDMLLGNFELRLPVDKNFSLVGFYDIGRAWRKEGENSSFGDDMGSSPGFGVRINTPLGNLRLDYATGDEGRFHFGFGELF
ncbi:MAG TPA: outer membrane protein assembly factor [Synergistaceae bacterium]|nr:outer membrane protein assembly factor [Synergistaceae bacterium]